MPKEDPFKYFRIEARELLERLSQDMIELEKQGSGKVLLERMRRDVHTLKGAARVVKQGNIAALAQAIEETLAPIRDSEGPVARDLIAKISGQLQDFSRAVAGLDQPQSEPKGPPVPQSPKALLETVRLELSEIDRLLQKTSETGIQLARLRGIARRILGRGERELSDALDQVDRDFEQLRETAQALRLIPASALFVPLERVASDVARNSGKAIEFTGVGGEVRIDGQVLSPLFEAFLHVVRNAVDHGIEPSEQRVRLGKPAAGRITMSIRREGHRVLIACGDDGRGIDLAAVKRRALATGLVSAAELQKAGDHEVTQLVLLPGLSTANGLSDISGRGIGLDVLNETTRKLNGEVAIRTTAGRGTSVEVKVPFSISSIPALYAQVDASTVAIPQDSVLRVFEAKSPDITWSRKEPRIIHDGKSVPFLPLSHLLHGTSSRQRARRTWTVIITGSPANPLALGVDRVLGVRTILARPLPKFLPPMPGISGSTLDSEGNPLFLIDPANLNGAFRPWSDDAEIKPEKTHDDSPVLVIDDSLTSRMLEQSILESAGYKVELAESAEAALSMAHNRRYLAFVCDVEMPGMSGFEFVRKIRQEPSLRGIPAIIVSTRESEADKRRGMEAGAQAYITKGNFDQNALLRTIERLR